MKTHHIIGMLWFGFCIYDGVQSLCEIKYLVDHRIPGVTVHSPDFHLGVLLCVFHWVGVLPSVFLFRGAKWARVFVGLYAAIFAGISILACTERVGFISVWGVFGLFGIISSVLLFWPRHEPVA
jgi:hypothetical protein